LNARERGIRPSNTKSAAFTYLLHIPGCAVLIKRIESVFEDSHSQFANAPVRLTMN
jgi:hypothetical protein